MRIYLLADDSHEISSLIISQNQVRYMPSLSSAAVMIGTLRVKDSIQGQVN